MRLPRNFVQHWWRRRHLRRLPRLTATETALANNVAAVVARHRPDCLHGSRHRAAEAVIRSLRERDARAAKMARHLPIP